MVPDDNSDDTPVETRPSTPVSSRFSSASDGTGLRSVPSSSEQNSFVSRAISSIRSTGNP